MNILDGVDADDLRAAVEDTSDPKAVKRLMVALAYKDGVAVDVISDRYGIPRSTIYSWLARFDERPIAEASRDDSRPGRPPALDDGEHERLAEALADPPSEHGLEGETWTPALVRRFIDREFGVTYSNVHAGRLLRRHGDG